MKRKTYLNIIFFVLLFLSQYAFAQKSLRFERNEGQWDKDILYKAERKEGKVFVREDRLTFLLYDSMNVSFHPHSLEKADNTQRYSIFSLKPLNANKTKLQEKELCQGYSNYFKGEDKSKWKSHVLSATGVIYKNIYDGVDWDISELFGNVKHTFIVSPGADISQIKVEYVGVERLSKEGNQLHLTTRYGEMIESEPYIYVIENGEEKKVEGCYVLQGNVVSYSVQDYDKTKTLYIDPGLVFSTYIGSHADSWGMTSCYDNMGMMISGGIVYGGDYPYTEGAYDTVYDSDWDCVITKYDSLGENLLFSTFLGGNKGEMPHSMIVNRNDEIVILGTTGSSNFPVSDNAFQHDMHQGETLIYETSITYPNGSDIFVTCLSPMGDNLVASTLIGGSGNDGLNFRQYYGQNPLVLYDGNDSLYYNYGDCARGELITDSANNVYVASCTFSSDFPTTTNAFQTSNHGGQEAVVFKFDHSLSSLLFSTYLGGMNDDAAYSIDIDNMGRIYVTGGTTSSNFPSTNNSYSPTYNGGTVDAFLSLLSSDGTTLISSTFYGSSEYDQAYFVRLDKYGNPHIYGQTKAPGSTLVHNVNYAIPNSGQFIAKFSPMLDNLVWSTVFGTGDGLINISPSGFAVDVCNRIYCAGWGRIFKYMRNTLGYSTLGTINMQVTPNAYMTQTDGQDFYIMSLASDASQLDYATFYGENTTAVNYGADHVDGGTSRFDRYGNLYQTICASCGASQDLPTTPNAWSDANLSANCNMASVKFNINYDFAVADFLTPDISCANTPITFNNLSRGDMFKWYFGDGDSSIVQNPTHTYATSGLYEVNLISYMTNACREYDTITKNVLILSDTSYFLDTISVCRELPTQIGLNYFSTTANENISYNWTPGEFLSDSTISNPYVSISNPTLFSLIIDNSYCKDTLYQYIDLERYPNDLPDTIEFCSRPYSYFVPVRNGFEVEVSYDRTFSSMLTMSGANHEIEINDTSRYLYVKYSQGACFDVDSVWLNFIGYDFTLQTYDVGCSSDDNGKAVVVSSSFPEGSTYVWSSNTSNNTPSIENLSVGEYTLMMIAPDGCYTSKTFSIGASTEIVINEIVNNSVCSGVDNGNIALEVSGGTYPYTYLWSNGTTDSIATNLSAGEYTYTLTDASGCVMTNTIKIEDSDSLTLILSSTNNHCEAGCSAVVVSNTSGGNIPYVYLWSNGETTKDIADVCNGMYSLEVEDANGCKTQSSVEVTNIESFDNFVVTSSSTQVYDGNTITLEATYLDGFDYTWTPSDYLSKPHYYVTNATVYETTTYVVFVTDNKGCYKEDSITVYAEYVQCDKPNIYVPNIFTPNNDGKNDVITVSGDYIDHINFAIYDRWGEKVFETEDVSQSWNGTFRNEPCQPGVYYYRLEVYCIGGKVYLTGGDITLVR